MDGVNMNAQVGIKNPGRIGADVCHLKLPKTFLKPFASLMEEEALVCPNVVPT